MHAVPKVMRLLKGIVTVKNITVMDFKIMEDSNKYDFETDNINEGDYYSLKAGSNNDNYSVFLYDVNSHILYYIHYNI